MYAEMTLVEMAGIKEWLSLQQEQLSSQLDSAVQATKKFHPKKDHFNEVKNVS